MSKPTNPDLQAEPAIQHQDGTVTDAEIHEGILDAGTGELTGAMLSDLHAVNQAIQDGMPTHVALDLFGTPELVDYLAEAEPTQPT